MPNNFIGVDVGTGSARTGVFDTHGKLLGVAKQNIALHREAGDRAEQSSSDVWRAVCKCVREAVKAAGVEKDSIKGLGFRRDLFARGPKRQGRAAAVGRSGDLERNVIVWMDHRAIDQSRRISATKHAVLDYVGGTISPEMETPKLLRLLENMPDTFSRAWQFMDLTDFLIWRATGSVARSVCTVVCKWTYLAHEKRWDADYFRRIGLGVLADEAFGRIGTEVVAPGTARHSGGWRRSCGSKSHA
jgi:D-ribulokinase